MDSTPDSKTLEDQLPTDTQSKILTRPIILGTPTFGSPTTATTIGANGAATALTANPVGYIKVMIGNTAYQMPYYNLA